MSPEQAEGKSIDHRSDIFSMGIILYEMATGQRPFKGDTTASILSAIIKDTPDSVTELNPELPRDLARLIRRCLAKNSEDRLQAAKDVRNELRELKQEVESGEVLEDVPTTVPRSRWRLPIVVAVAVVIAGTVGYLLRTVEKADETSRELDGTYTRLTSQAGPELFPSLSPDGEFFAYASAVSGNWDIYLQRVGGETAINLTKNSAAADTQPAFSLDGKQIAFRSERDGGGIFIMGSTGENVRRLTDFGEDPAWSPDGGQIAFGEEEAANPTNRDIISKLWAVAVTSGEQRLITQGDAVEPSWSPHGHRIAYWGRIVEKGSLRDIWTMPAEGGESIPVTQDAALDWSPVWSPEGRFLYFLSNRGGAGNLWRISIEEVSGDTLGEPQPMNLPSNDVDHLAISQDGNHIAYTDWDRRLNLFQVDFDPQTGKTQRQPVAITSGTTVSANPDVSPDGEWLVFDSWGTYEQVDILIIRTDGTGRRRLTSDAFMDLQPRWSPDGSRIAFISNRGGKVDIWTIEPDGSGLEQLTYEGNSIIPVWSADGSQLAYSTEGYATHIIDLVNPREEQTRKVLPKPDWDGDRFQVRSWSPDGNLLAGRLVDVHGREFGVAIYSLDSQQYHRLVDHPGGFCRWLNDSRRLLFSSGGKLYMMDSVSGEYEEVLSVVPDILGRFCLSRDNRTIYYHRSSEEADIWMLTLNEERE
jgi:Tol biopolymer transport system component